MSLEGDNEYLSSVKWIPGGQHIAVGNSNHEVQVLPDVIECKFSFTIHMISNQKWFHMINIQKWFHMISNQNGFT